MDGTTMDGEAKQVGTELTPLAVGGFDLDAASDADAAFDLPLGFDDNGNPAYGFKCLTSNSKKYRDLERDWQKRNFRKAASRGRGIDASSENGAEELARQVAAHDRALVEACIVDAYGFTKNKQPLPFNDGLITMLLDKRPAWIPKILTEIRADRDFS